jgi:hypothetical protein
MPPPPARPRNAAGTRRQGPPTDKLKHVLRGARDLEAAERPKLAAGPAKALYGRHGGGRGALEGVGRGGGAGQRRGGEGQLPRRRARRRAGRGAGRRGARPSAAPRAAPRRASCCRGRGVPRGRRRRRRRVAAPGAPPACGRGGRDVRPAARRGAARRVSRRSGPPGGRAPRIWRPRSPRSLPCRFCAQGGVGRTGRGRTFRVGLKGAGGGGWINLLARPCLQWDWAGGRAAAGKWRAGWGERQSRLRRVIPLPRRPRAPGSRPGTRRGRDRQGRPAPGTDPITRLGGAGLRPPPRPAPPRRPPPAPPGAAGPLTREAPPIAALMAGGSPGWPRTGGAGRARRHGWQS